MTTTMVCRDLHLRHTGVDGSSFVQCHRVWDADMFLNACSDGAARANTKAATEGGPRVALATVELLTRDEYLAARGKVSR